MSNDWSGGGDFSSGENPYAPGDAALAMEEPQREDPDSEFKISPGPRPQKASVGRAFRNFQILFSAALGPVGWAWGALAVAYFVVYFLGMGAIVGLSSLGSVNSGADLFTSSSFGIGVGLVMMVVLTCFGALFMGLTRALREVAFWGEHAISSVGDAVRLATKRFGILLGFFFVWFILMSIPSFLSGLIGGLGNSPMLGGIFSLVFVSFVSMALSPMFYVVPSSNSGLGEAVGDSLSIAGNHLGYLILCFLLLFIGVIGTGCVLALFVFVPFLGLMMYIPGIFVLLFAVWVAFVAIFATIEEAEAGFFPLHTDPGF